MDEKEGECEDICLSVKYESILLAGLSASKNYDVSTALAVLKNIAQGC